MIPDAIVVGSGPAGISAASALLKRGRTVWLLDAGLRLEPERHALAERLAATPPAQWDEATLAQIKSGMAPGAEGIPLKKLFGSDFVFRETDRFAALEQRHTGLNITLAEGGFSNVWGAGAIPFSDHDLAGWPIGARDLAPFYQECLEEMDLAARVDDLAEDFPIYSPRPQPLRPSRQAAMLLQDLERHREALRRAGMRFGTSRLAVKAAPETGGPGCSYCGLCLYGCPYGYIYNSGAALESLRSHPQFRYEPGAIITALDEKPDRVVLRGKSLHDTASRQFEAKRAFLACGPIGSTAVLLESMGACNRPVELADSLYFVGPMLHLRHVPGVENEALHTLAQVFLELRDPGLSPHGIHLSVYTYNDLLPQALLAQAGIVGRLLPALPRAFAKRLLVFGGYLHSADSPRIQLRLSGAAGQRRIELRGGSHPNSAEIVRKTLSKMAKLAGKTKALPLSPFVRRGLPGRGYHTGGSFPMGAVGGDFRSDLVGRPAGFTRVHAVDATVFPNIPAPNLTLTVMANARRIAAETTGL